MREENHGARVQTGTSQVASIIPEQIYEGVMGGGAHVRDEICTRNAGGKT
jgi:hypothetical protein